MTSYAWTLPGPGTVATGTTAQEQADQLDRLWGHDIWLDVSDLNGGDVHVGPDGDYKLATGEQALRQAVIRRIITTPGEWAALPDYGVGARSFLKSRNTRASRDALTGRIKSQLLQDERIARVDGVAVEFFNDSSGIKISVAITPAGQLQRPSPLIVYVEVT